VTEEPEGWLNVSAVTGEGIEALESVLADVVLSEVQDLGGGVAVAERHRRCLAAAAEELNGAVIEEPELAAEAVRWALESIRELTGEVVNDAVLDEVFATFCIGK
jgi:tRNA modification GTPase